MGFIFIEVVFLQHFTLFLGQPIDTFAVVLAGLLMFTGLARTCPIVGCRTPHAARSIIPALLVLLLSQPADADDVPCRLGPSRFLHG